MMKKIFSFVCGLCLLMPGFGLAEESYPPDKKHFEDLNTEENSINPHLIDMKRLKNGISKSQLISGDIYESEYNDSISTADSIQLDKLIHGTITDYYFDMDYYKLEITQPGVLNILGLLGDYSDYSDYLVIGVKDKNGNSLDYSDTVETSDGDYMQVLEKYLNPGTYYIVVFQDSDYQYLLVDEGYTLKAYMTDIQPIIEKNADLNNDGIVDTLDIVNVTKQYGSKVQ